MGRQKRIAATIQRGRIGQRFRAVIDGPSPDHELVLRARTEGQAPDIDPCVYLTECDPSELRPGDFVDIDVVGARGYDLIGRLS